MKNYIPITTLSLICALTPSSLQGQQRSTKPPTLEEIEKQQTAEQQKERKTRKKTTAVLSPIKTAPSSLLGDSTLLTHNGNWTLAPKGSVLHVPTHYQKMVTTTPQGTLISWKKFLRLNRGWLQTVPVTRQQVSGKEPINPKTLKAQRSIGKVIVTTLSHIPIALPKQDRTTALK